MKLTLHFNIDPIAAETLGGEEMIKAVINSLTTEFKEFALLPVFQMKIL